jgi:ribosomal protein RSM22 (predicted rRNA methylase)
VITLPHALEDAVATRLRSADPRALTRAAQALSERYRGERETERRIASGAEDALAYAGWILPATHAQVSGALRMIPRRAGEWEPKTLLDLGAGPGTTAWAAAAIWPSLERVVAVEREPAFVALGRDLARASPHASVREAEWRTEDLRRLDLGSERYDLVVIGLVANEMASGEAGMLLREAWGACDGVLAIVEPGTPSGFGRVEAMRRALLAQGAHALAPCPHGRACPLAGGDELEPPDWCHFAERTQRPEFQRRLKGAELGWEDAKLSFFCGARFDPGDRLPWARVLRHPLHGKGHVELDLCSREGRLARTIGRSSPDWKLARKLDWGDAWESPPSAGHDVGAPIE